MKFVDKKCFIEVLEVRKDLSFEQVSHFLNKGDLVFCGKDGITIKTCDDKEITVAYGDYIAKNYKGDVYPISSQTFDLDYIAVPDEDKLTESSTETETETEVNDEAMTMIWCGYGYHFIAEILSQDFKVAGVSVDGDILLACGVRIPLGTKIKYIPGKSLSILRLSDDSVLKTLNRKKEGK